MLSDFEGFREESYQDSAGVWTIGFGTTRIDGRAVQQGDTITRTHALEILREHASGFARVVDDLVPQSIEQVAFDALVSFAYNIGARAFEESTLLRLLVEGDLQGAADQFPRWIYAGGEKSDGLRKRRSIERALFLYGCAR